MASFRLGSSPPSNQQQQSATQNTTLTPRELVDKYSGLGLQFKVKYVGSENVNRRRGDAEAARYCIPTLRIASKNMGAHKPRAVLGLSIKGVSLYDEKSKSVTRVPVDKVTYVSHDPEDMCYFGIIIQTKDSHTGFRLYCFKAEKIIATNFVVSARELFGLMLKLRQAKKKIQEEKEATSKDPEHTNPETTNLPAENAPPPSYISVTESDSQFQQTQNEANKRPPERPPPPMPNQAPVIPPRPPSNAVLFSLEDETPQRTFAEEYDTFSSSSKKQDPMAEWETLGRELDSITVNKPPPTQDDYMTIQPPPASSRTRPQASAKPPPPNYPPPPDSSGLDDLGDIFLGLPPIATQSNVTSSNNPFSQAQPVQVPSYPLQNTPQTFSQEPSITIDLMDAIKNPQPGTMSSYPPQAGIGMGMGMPGMGQQPYGMPNQYPGVNYSMGGVGGGAYQQPNPFVNASYQQQLPPADIFSLPTDPLLDSTFSQPLLPVNTVMAPAQQQQKPAGRPDAFSDLVSIARNKASTTVAPPKGNEWTDAGLPPLPERPPNLRHANGTGVSSGMMLAFEEELKTNPVVSTSGGGGFDDAFGDNFIIQATPQPSSSDKGWISF